MKLEDFKVGQKVRVVSHWVPQRVGMEGPVVQIIEGVPWPIYVVLPDSMSGGSPCAPEELEIINEA